MAEAATVKKGAAVNPPRGASHGSYVRFVRCSLTDSNSDTQLIMNTVSQEFRGCGIAKMGLGELPSLPTASQLLCKKLQVNYRSPLGWTTRERILLDVSVGTADT